MDDSANVAANNEPNLESPKLDNNAQTRCRETFTNTNYSTVSLFSNADNNAIISCLESVYHAVSTCCSSGRNAGTWCFEAVSNAFASCHNYFNNARRWCHECVNNVVTWFHEWWYTGQPSSLSLLKIAWKILGLLLHVFDLCTDLYQTYRHFHNDDKWWGSLTAVFTFLPMMISSIWLNNDEVQINEYSRYVKCLWPLPAIFCSPIVPFCILVWRLVESIRSFPDDVNDAAMHAEIVKLCGSVGESYPQACLQTYIVFQQIFGKKPKPVEDLQYVSIVASFTYMSFVVSRNAIFDKAASTSKLVFFVFGLLAVVSRVVVACAYSTIHNYLLCVPIVTELGASIIMWSIRRCCPTPRCVPLDDGHSSNEIGDIVFVVLTWLLTAVYNSFTISGFVVSTINVAFAVGACCLGVPESVKIIALTLSAISWVINLIIIVVPQFKAIRNDWIAIDENNESTLY
ncbi:unnamed protein product [Meganyctiphanes norvegica]|uniref:XK-related protein n=1 Tax=Meganyctiphanes norvegica TaxID=48144 RepID=A0AAV2Q542_MEGNR